MTLKPLMDALRTFVKERGYELDEGPLAELMIPVRSTDPEQTEDLYLRISVMLLDVAAEREEK